ncbi:FkbM family methyltransferase [Haloarchaeobius amylolyticus]|uniref:FkbM family methyltransferase n=1 Tax=Haloarchaeobius amylolyticus TaxID=1198296 RepID=UPI00226FB424|nr:FkbM family methyltransferase [Haloarchaeobius amylolyticus]
MSLGSRLTGAYQRHGATDLARVSLDAVRYRLIDQYWALRGARPVTVDGVSAGFRTRTVGESRMVRNLPDMESVMLEDLLDELRPDDVFFDVGGHMGLFACLAAEQTPRGHVVAFEPYPPMRELLELNVEHNDADVAVFDVALSNEAGQATLDNPFKHRSEWSGTASLDPQCESGVEIETAVGDDLVEQGVVDPPSVVKIDVEGAEGVVIDGLSETLSRPECRVVYCEVHEPTDTRRSTVDYGREPDEVVDTLADLGFEVRVLADRGHDRHVKAVRQE